jgi:hypothetical protein
MTLEELLAEDGWTAQDIAAVAPMLADNRFNARLRVSLEKKYGAVVTERDQLKEKDAEWDRLRREEWQVKLSAEEKKAQAAELKASELETRLKLAKDYGYITPEAEAKANAEIEAARVAANGYDPKKHPSWEDVNKFADAEAEAMAILNDLNNDYSRYYPGQSLTDYETEIGGQRLRGTRALRAEAKAKRVPLDQYVSEKFDFKGKREALVAKRQQERDDKIRQEAADAIRKEFAEKLGNPMMRDFAPSRSPFMTKKPDGKMPWEVPAPVAKAGRVDRALKVQLGQQVN